MSSARAQPASLEAGTSTAITVVVTAHSEATVLINIELHDGRGVRAAQWVFDNETLPRDEPAAYDVRWQPSPGMQSGIYMIKIGVFTAGWGPLHHRNDGSGVLLIAPPESPVE